MNNSKCSYNIVVYGRVQGVGFRWSSRETARKYGITGFVKNQMDGSVYIEAEGYETSINIFIKWCQNGPDGAIVKEVKYYKQELINFKSFEVKY